MATNMTQLLTGLKEYRLSLERHSQLVSAEYQQVEQRWQGFSSVYEGTAANVFRSNWIRTQVGFEEYISAVQRISRLLDQRISALIVADSGNLDL